SPAFLTLRRTSSATVSRRRIAMECCGSSCRRSRRKSKAADQGEGSTDSGKESEDNMAEKLIIGETDLPTTIRPRGGNQDVIVQRNLPVLPIRNIVVFPG